ncbi:MAG: CoA protein activase [Firmicutes bacterium]|nr:CoA protein activase [Dethiobacter sp.]MBS3888531.1 CoA protein activase [Bacillota bacterium]
MRVTFPHMGTLSLAMRALLENLGLQVVMPPPITSRTLALGAKYSPECVCLPFKVNVGNYIEAIELGADTVVMAGGIGPCRFGYYAELQREILADLGLSANMIVLEPPQGMVTELWRKISSLTRGHSFMSVAQVFYFAWRLAKGLDGIEKTLHQVRALEKTRGSCDIIWNEAQNSIGQTRTLRGLWAAERLIKERIAALPKKTCVHPLRVGLVGEIYMLLEPKVNLGLAERLGYLGVEVHRSMSVSDWVTQHLVPDPRAQVLVRKIRQAAKPYLRGHVGGHGLETIGHSVLYAEEGMDGIIQVLPLTCMPEIVAQSILPTISEKYGIPILTLVLDEHAGEGGLQTRLEAFVDMLRARQRRGRAITSHGN